jgi:hypothetical protein
MSQAGRARRMDRQHSIPGGASEKFAMNLRIFRIVFFALLNYPLFITTLRIAKCKSRRQKVMAGFLIFLRTKPYSMTTKTQITRFSFALLLCLVIFNSCKKEDSQDVNQDKIYAEYELYYDKASDKTYASAIFKFSNVWGTNLQLTSPSEVKFNNDVIPYDPVFAYYRKEYAGLVTSGTFYFKDTDGTTYTNPVSNADVISFPAVDTIHNAGSYTFNWVGDSVLSNHWIELYMDGTAQNNAELFIQYTLNSKNFVLAANRLQNLGTGNAISSLTRVRETVAPAVTSAGGKIRGKYHAQNKTIYITP